MQGENRGGERGGKRARMEVRRLPDEHDTPAECGVHREPDSRGCPPAGRARQPLESPPNPGARARTQPSEGRQLHTATLTALKVSSVNEFQAPKDTR